MICFAAVHNYATTWAKPGIHYVRKSHLASNIVDRLFLPHLLHWLLTQHARCEKIAKAWLKSLFDKKKNIYMKIYDI